MVSFVDFVLFVFAVVSVKSENPKPLVTDIVTWDISVGDNYLGQIKIGVFADAFPKTAKNFIELSSGNRGFGYEGSHFHRVIKDFMIQGGDFVSNDGYGVKSIYGGKFDDEHFDLNHVGPGWLSMANAGPNTNGCQFFITLVPCPWLNGKHMVFGKVLQGMDIVNQIGQVSTNDKDRPLENVTITKSVAEKASEVLYVENVA